MFNFFKKHTIEKRSTSSTCASDVNPISLGRRSSLKPKPIAPEQALNLIDVRACIDIISSDIASLSLHAYERKDNDERVIARDHNVALRVRQPNPDMTKHDWLQSSLNRVLTFGNAFDFIDWQGGRIAGIHPLGNSKVEIIRPNGNLKYRVTIDTETRDLEPYQILHFRGFTLDGVNGMSPLQQAASTVSAGLQMAKMQENFFSEGLHLGGVLEHPQTISQEATNNLRKQINDKHQGVDAAFRWLILQEGMKFEPLGIPFEQAQFVEQAKLTTLAISRLYRVPSNRLNVTEGSQSFASAEQASIQYYVSCIRPWLDKLEEEMNMKLWHEAEKQRFYLEFDPASLLRGDQASQDESFRSGVNGGWYSVNNVLKKLNLPPVENGHLHYRPLNLKPIEWDTAPEPAKQEPRAIDLSELFADASKRILTKEIKAIQRAVKKEPAEFMKWAKEFYLTHEELVRESFGPVMRTAGREAEIEQLAASHCRQQLQELALTMWSEQIEADINNTIEQWQNRRIDEQSK